MYNFGVPLHIVVIRRVGGLEDPGKQDAHEHYVIRRVGGLEVWNGARYRRKIVIRRVGGLEVIYPKNKKDTLTDKETSILRELVKELAHG